MRISHTWLQQYCKFRLTPEELAERMTMRGLEFESIERLGDRFRGFVVGKVMECTPHPNADKLTVCKVDVGKETLQIVCGAPNVAAGQKVPVGLVGATIPRNQHDTGGNPFMLSHVKLRGVDSYGMICSEYELDLGPDADTILVLESDARIGQPLASFLGLDDVAYEVAVTPNRPDLLSHIGVAREIRALTRGKLTIPVVKVHESKTQIRSYLDITVVDKKNCLRFAVRMVLGVTVGPSPRWLQHRLRAAGLRPRNNVVDITNFVMLECGHPLHAFDYSLLQGHKIIVRQAKEGSRFATLDGKEHTLPAECVMVCDAEREVSIAGIMGGANSEISDTTTNVVIESAYWNPSSIRLTSKRLGISSDASQRFERGADPQAVLYALNRATQLISEIAGGQVLQGTIDVYPKEIRERTVQLRPDRVNSVLGMHVSRSEIINLLKLLEIRLVRSGAGKLTFKIPTYRVDAGREIDLIEEVARTHGYDRIQDDTTATVDFAHPFSQTRMSDLVREHLVGMGYQEALSNSMMDRDHAALGNGDPVLILNPQNKGMGFLRTSLVPGLLEAVARNQSFGNFDLRLFEIGHTFSVDNSDRPKLVENYLEEERVCMLLTGSSAPRHWDRKPAQVDLYDVKGQVATFLDKFALDKSQVISYPTSVGLADDSLRIEINGSYAGYFGSVRDEILEVFGIEGAVFVAEVNLACLSSTKTKTYEPLPRFPKVTRDVAFVVDAMTNAAELEKAIRQHSSKLLHEVEVFDVYQGENLQRGKKSIAFSLELMSLERTLTDEEIDAELRRIIKGVEEVCGASLRAV